MFKGSILISIALPYNADDNYWLSYLQNLPYPVCLDSSQQGYATGQLNLISGMPSLVTGISPQRKTYLKSLTPEISYQDQVSQLSFSDQVHQMHKSLAASDAENHFTGGVIGFCSYHAGEILKQVVDGDLKESDLYAGLYLWWVELNHAAQKATLFFHIDCPEFLRQHIENLFQSPPPKLDDPFSLTAPFQLDTTWQQYQNGFEAVIDYIKAGDAYQVNFTQRLSSHFNGHPLHGYQLLRASVPAPFSAFLSFGNQHILSCSPERFLKISNRDVESRPIKGTRKRHSDPTLNQNSIEELMSSKKDRAENVMIVDLLRNDLGVTAETGSVSVPVLCGLESYSNVHHLVSTVTATLASNVSELDCFLSAFPGGSITGAPKLRAMEIIQELEQNERGPYCGSIFYWSCNGEFDSSILIRTMRCEGHDIHVWGGGGVVSDSKLEQEYQESLDKIEAMTRSLENHSGL